MERFNPGVAGVSAEAAIHLLAPAAMVSPGLSAAGLPSYGYDLVQLKNFKPILSAHIMIL
jgi:hypothetical protein